MPYVKIMNLNKEKSAKAVKNILDDISKVAGVKESGFHFFNCGDSTFQHDGDSTVYIEISWYARDSVQMQNVSKLFYDEIKKHGDYDVHVVFNDIASLEHHYSNGKQYNSN